MPGPPSNRTQIKSSFSPEEIIMLYLDWCSPIEMGYNVTFTLISGMVISFKASSTICRSFGMVPGWIYDITISKGSSPASVSDTSSWLSSLLCPVSALLCCAESDSSFPPSVPQPVSAVITVIIPARHIANHRFLIVHPPFFQSIYKMHEDLPSSSIPVHMEFYCYTSIIKGTWQFYHIPIRYLLIHFRHFFLFPSVLYIP